MPDAPKPPATCPICDRPTEASVRPFCSRRCAEVDLGRWFAGQYRTPSLRIETDEDDDDRIPPA